MADLARIKNNVAKMAAQGAPEQDIDGYIASEGVTVDDVRNFRAGSPNQPPGVPEFVPPGVEGYDPATGEVTPQYGRLGSAAMGAADSATFGFGDELTAGLVTGGGLLGDYGKTRDEIRGFQGAAQTQNPGSYLTGQIGGGVAQAVGTGGAGFGANAIRSGAGLARTGAGMALDGAIYGGLQGAGGGTDAGSRASGALVGSTIGGAVGFASPYVAAGVKSLGRNTVGRLVTPFGTSPERAAAAKALANEGVQTTAGQRTGSKALRYAEGELGGARAADLADEQGRAFTNAAMRKAGGSGLAEPGNLGALKDNLGKGFDSISKRNTLRADQQIINDMNRANMEYGKVLKSDQKSIFGKLGNDIIDKFRQGKGSMSGEQYQTIRSRLTRMVQNYRNNDPEFSDAIRGLRDALDSGMDRSIMPADKGAWTALRRKYGNYKVLERASLGGGEDAALGVISPARLRMAASSGNRGGFATGKSDFTELAKAGQALMTPLPNSGTAGRISARSLGQLGPSIVGAGAGGAYGAQNEGGFTGALAGALAGFVAPKAVGKLLMSKAGQRYLANQLIKSGPMTAGKRALLNAVLTYGGQEPAKRLTESLVPSLAQSARP
jgi:hypothetical protein